MDETAVVTCFLRHDSDVLLFRRSEAVGSYQGRWGAVAGHAEGDPEAATSEEIREETGLDPETAVSLVRQGDPFSVEDQDLDTRWVVHPFLFDIDTRSIVVNEETIQFEWAPPTAILRRETVPQLWTSYDRVRPHAETVESDRDHGSAYLSLRALEVLRDEAALAVEGGSDADWQDLEAIARDLVGTRPSMPVVTNRVDRAMTDASEDATPAALEESALDGIEAALAADDEAARAAAERVSERRVATLSRSGTVSATLDEADPEAVLVAESRPGSEGVAVAEGLAADLEASVTLTSDAALAHQLAAWDAEALLVGADAVLADGSVVNKVGTRGAAIAGSHEGIDVVAVTASDKVSPREKPADPEARDPADLYDGEADLEVANPTFDVTPGGVVDAVVTERGALVAEDVAAVAAEHRHHGAWRRE
ncbi:NUDIX domain-containing protein [Halobacteriales archaeon Cl-PHB]